MARGVFDGFLGLLGATAALVLLIAATNVAGMFLARASQRGRELAVRRALGASRWRIVRQLLAESVVIGALGATSGIVLGSWLLRLLTWRLGALGVPVTISTSLDLRMDPRVVAVSAGIAMLAGILAGLVPALGSTRVALVPALRGDGRAHDVRGTARRRFVVAQLAMSLALIVAAGLFTRALRRALDVDPGFNPDGVVLGGINLAPHGYAEARGREFYAQLLARLRARPEFTSVALGRNTPLGGENNGEGVLLPGESGPRGRRIDVLKGAVSDGFLATVRIPLVGGRTFAADDDANAAPVVIVNQTLGRRLLNDSLPLGRTVRVGGKEREIVGVVKDGKYRSLGEAPTSYAFIPFAQDYDPRMFVFAHVRGSTDGAIAALREEVARLDRNVALELPRSLSTAVDLWRLPPRLAAILIGAFGIVGLGLAAIGVYGVLAFRVAMRTREFGVRLALGATSGRLLRDVLREGISIAVVGTLAGLLLAAGLGRAMAGFLYGVGAFDPLTFATGAAILAVTALVAAYLPARRAARVDPLVSLRAE